MNDFAQPRAHYRQRHDEVDLVGLSLWSRPQCRAALYKSYLSPDRALQALLGRPAGTGRP